MESTIEVRAVAVADVLALRHRVLRVGLPPETAVLDGDSDPGTVALAAFVPDLPGPVSTATLMDQPCPWRPGVPARRLRAMATDAAVQGRGVGSAVVAAAADRARADGAELVWCNARVAAAAFYARAGFAVDGEVFDTPDFGPHLRMALELG